MNDTLMIEESLIQNTTESQIPNEAIAAPQESYVYPKFGIPLERIEVNGIFDMNLTCTICHLLLNDPVSCKICENHFCSKCIEHYRNHHNDECADDSKKEYKQRPVQKLMNSLLSKLNIYCIYKAEGCDQILKYDKLYEHELLCDFQLIPCNNEGCSQKTIKKNFQAHFELCSFYKMPCVYCNQMYTRSLLQKHQQNCDFLPRSCPGCAREIYNKDFEEHYSSCPEVKLKCPKCMITLTRVMMEIHNQNELECIKQQIKELKVIHHITESKLKKLKKITNDFIQCDYCLRLVCDSCSYECSGKFCELENVNVEVKKEKSKKCCRKCKPRILIKCNECKVMLCFKCQTQHSCHGVESDSIILSPTLNLQSNLQKRKNMTIKSASSIKYAQVLGKSIGENKAGQSTEKKS